ncbi:MAG: sensor histidine kinase, partial [Bacteroidota bacterium]
LPELGAAVAGKKLADQQLEQQKLITEVTIQAQEKERNELGRELHDNINQILATIKMYIGMAKEKEPPPKDLINQSYLYVSEAMEEIRKLSHSLVAPSLGDIGLNEALEELVQEINISNNLQVELICNTRTEKDIDDKMELMLYRIAQEQMNNILKYSQAKKAVINLQRDENNVFLIISDDGLGFDTSKTAKGIGLRNIHSRAEFYSGTMSVISAPGKGCTLEITIPY